MKKVMAWYMETHLKKNLLGFSAIILISVLKGRTGHYKALPQCHAN